MHPTRPKQPHHRPSTPRTQTNPFKPHSALPTLSRRRYNLDLMHGPHMRNHLIPPREPKLAVTMARPSRRRIDIRARHQVQRGPVVDGVHVAL